MTFGERLKQARLSKGLNQEQVANYFYVTRQTISSWENETTYPNLDNLIKLSDYYELSLDELIKNDLTMQNYLKKRDIQRSIKPVTYLLLLIDLLFLGIIALVIFNVIRISMIISLILSLLISLNGIALIQLSSFQQSLSPKPWRLFFPKIVGLFLTVGFIFIGSIITFFSNQALIGGLFFGIGFGILILLLTHHFQKFR